jgi:hypothetical protein
MRIWLCVLHAACGDDTSHASDASSIATLTIDRRAVGMVVSNPPGIQCGSCAYPMCPDPQTASDCSADFAPGTQITLMLTRQMTYFAVHCTSNPPAIDTTGSNVECAFAMPQSATVAVTGARAIAPGR